MNPTPVTIIRPMKPGVELVYSLFYTAFGAWLLMLLLPAATDGSFHPGYWRSAAISMVASILFKGYDYPWISKARDER